MNLKKELQQSGYDLINSPIRNHKLLQLWLKKSNNVVDLYHENIADALISEIGLKIIEDNALSVNYNFTQDFEFNVGITVLDALLSTLGLGDLGLNTILKTGKKMSLSYDHSKTLTVASGEISNYLTTSRFKYQNNEFIRNANRDNILIISGVLMARDLKSIIETDMDINAEIETQLTQVAKGKIGFKQLSGNKLELISEGNNPFPIAVKAHRLYWKNDKFDKMTIVTDNRFFF